MKTYSMDAIRNIAVMGHGKCGKTTLTEAMLFNAKMTDRMGKVADGNTVTDYDGEEIKRQFSISTALATVEWKDMKYNMIDTPGFFDFVGDVKEGIRAADSALIVLSGRSGVSSVRRTCSDTQNKEVCRLCSLSTKLTMTERIIKKLLRK